MKNLKDYIIKENCNISSHFKVEYNQECYLNSILEFFGDELPKDFNDNIKNITFKDYILESLTSHDINLLIKKISTEYSDVKIDFINAKEQSFNIISSIDLTKESKFNYMLEIFGFYVTFVKNINDKFNIIICPRYTKDANKIVYQQNHGKLYHFTASVNAAEIERLGLRCKKSTYRNFPERIYLYASDKHLDKIQDIDKFIKKVISPFDIRNNELYIYRIDLNKLKSKTYINLYTDDQMEEENAVFTYNNIPAECITRLNIDLSKIL